MWTIDIPGNTGYNPYPAAADMPHPPAIGEILPNTGTNNQAYTARFGGTSHACPVVAGVAALILSVNPDFSYMDVFNILTSTADKVGDYTYTSGKCNEMGYGRVNAHAALLETLDQMNLTLSGPSLICTSGTFTINNPPDGATVSWNKSSNLSGGSGGTFTANGSGEGWVEATLTTGCGEVTLPRKTVWVGKPDPDYIGFINIGPYYPGGSQICLDVPNDGIASWNGSGEILEYEWDAGNWQVVQHPMDPFADIPMKNVQITAPPYGYDNPLHVTIKARNQCGWGSYSAPAIILNGTNCYRSYYLSFSPNPTNGETVLYIVQDNIAGDISLKSTSTETSFDENAEWDIEVYDNMQSLKLKKQKLRGKSTRINTQSWKEGVYMVRVNYNGELLTGKLIVK